MSARRLLVLLVAVALAWWAVTAFLAPPDPAPLPSIAPGSGDPVRVVPRRPTRPRRAVGEGEVQIDVLELDRDEWRPRGEVTVVVQLDGGVAARTGRTDAEGVWVAKAIPPGEWRVAATAPGALGDERRLRLLTRVH